jgi:hypothetical protein
MHELDLPEERCLKLPCSLTTVNTSYFLSTTSCLLTSTDEAALQEIFLRPPNPRAKLSCSLSVPKENKRLTSGFVKQPAQDAASSRERGLTCGLKLGDGAGKAVCHQGC